MIHPAFAIPAALALGLTVLPVRAQDNNITVSAADFQRMVYSAHLHTQLALKPELGACLQTLLEAQRRNPNADPMALADVSRQALQFYRTNEPVYIRTNGYPDEILAAYLDALRHIPAHTNFVPANLTLLNYFMLDAADLNFDTNYAQTPVDLINSAKQQLLLAERRGAQPPGPGGRLRGPRPGQRRLRRRHGQPAVAGNGGIAPGHPGGDHRQHQLAPA